MKRIMKKNQLIIAALAVMIVVAGYLNFTGQEISSSGIIPMEETADDTKETADEVADISEEDETLVLDENGEVIASEENPGEAVMVSNTLNSDYFTSAKLSREQSRAKNKETLLEIINNKEISSKEKKAAVREVTQITEIAEQENSAEMLLEAKGFSDAVVSISDGTADVVVSTDELTDKQMAQIEDIVKRKTSVSPENIVITPVKLEGKK